MNIDLGKCCNEPSNVLLPNQERAPSVNVLRWTNAVLGRRGDFRLKGALLPGNFILIKTALRSSFWLKQFLGGWECRWNPCGLLQVGVNDPFAASFGQSAVHAALREPRLPSLSAQLLPWVWYFLLAGNFTFWRHRCKGFILNTLQGRFVQCEFNSKIHHYHRNCQLPISSGGKEGLCPHCGSISPTYDVRLEMKMPKKPVFLPHQRQLRKE